MSDPPPPAPAAPPPPPAPPPPAPAPPPAAPATPSRRWFLAGGAAVLLGGGAGVLVQSLGSAEAPPPGPPPAALLAAIRAERTLIADLDATTGGSTHVRRLVVQVRADHVAHLRALRALLPAFRRPRTAEDGRPVGTPRTLAHLRAAEQHASLAAAGHASALDGADAALLASIAACEAAHAELLR